MIDTEDATFLAPRRCLREPVDEIFIAADLLTHAVDAHLAGDVCAAGEFIKRADLPPIRAWTESLWGSSKSNPEQWRYIRYRQLSDAPPLLGKGERTPVRMPNASEKKAVLRTYGYNCCFCGIPLVRSEVRKAFTRIYPEEAYWGGSNASQHAAFQCMWLQYDHLLPHCRGGDNSLSNVVITCAGCNYGSMQWTIDELGLMDPRTRSPLSSVWDGLERFLG